MGHLPQATGFILCQTQNISGYARQQGCRQEHLTAGQLGRLGGTELLLKAAGKCRSGTTILLGLVTTVTTWNNQKMLLSILDLLM